MGQRRPLTCTDQEQERERERGMPVRVGEELRGKILLSAHRNEKYIATHSAKKNRLL